MENARASSDIRRLEEEIRSLRAEIVGLKEIVLSSGPETIQNNGDSGGGGISASDSDEVQPPPSLGSTPFALVARMMTYLSSADCITFTTACMMMPNGASPALDELNEGAGDSAPMRAALVHSSIRRTQVEVEGEEIIADLARDQAKVRLSLLLKSAGAKLKNGNQDELIDETVMIQEKEMEEVVGAMKRKNNATAAGFFRIFNLYGGEEELVGGDIGSDSNIAGQSVPDEDVHERATNAPGVGFSPEPEDTKKTNVSSEFSIASMVRNLKTKIDAADNDRDAELQLCDEMEKMVNEKYRRKREDLDTWLAAAKKKNEEGARGL